MAEASDVDILVELDDDKSLLDFIHLQHELEDVLGRKVDLVEYATINPVIRDQILSEQLPIFMKRNPRLYLADIPQALSG